MTTNSESLVRLLSTAEVAELLGVSRWHVSDLARRGDLPSVVLGRRLRRFHPEDVAGFIHQRRDGRG